MSVLITGTDGFVGSHLIELFPANLGQLYSPSYKELDLTDSHSVSQYLIDKDIHYCIHSATTPRFQTTYPPDVCEQNLRMFFNLVRYLPSKCRIVNLGSGSEYSRSLWRNNMREDFFDDTIPTDSHSLSKYIISKFIHSDTSNRFVTVRIFGIFGEREDYLYKFISNTIVKSLFNISPVINQDCLFNYIDVRDFSTLLFSLLPNQALYRLGSLNIGHPYNYKLSEITSYILELTGRQDLSFKISSQKLGKSYTPCLDRMQSLLPNTYNFTPIKQSILRLVSYYTNNIDLLSRQLIIDDDYLNYAKSIMQ